MELARTSGYTDRLIRKAESGGSLDHDTIRNIAEALSIRGSPVDPSDLCYSVLDAAKSVVKAYDDLGRDMIPHIQHLLADDFVWNCPANPTIAPFSGEWHGARGLQEWLDIFFSIFTRQSGSLLPRYMVGDRTVTARYEDVLYLDEKATPPFWVNLHFFFRDNLIIRIDDEYDTKSAETSHKTLLS